MHSYAGKRLWSKPRFSSRQDLDFVQKISHFPILELHTNDFKCSWLELLCLVPQLKLLHIDTEKCYQNAETVQESHLRFLTRLPVAVVVHTRAFKVVEYNDIFQLYQTMKSINVQSMVIDHQTHLWSFELFRMFVDQFPISKISMNCFEMNEGNVVDYIKTISNIKDCEVILADPIDIGDDSHRFEIKDVELMIKLDIKITRVETGLLNAYDDDIPKLFKFADLCRKMKHLKEFNFHREDHFKLSVDQFALLKDLPVKTLCLETLNLKKDNIVQFRQIMSEMKIEWIEQFWFEKDWSQYDFEVSIQSFGPNGLYKTI